MVFVAVVFVMSYKSETGLAAGGRYLSQIKLIDEEIYKLNKEESKYGNFKATKTFPIQSFPKIGDFRCPKMIRVLRMATGGSASLEEVQRVVAGLKYNNPKIQSEFLGNFWRFSERHLARSADELCMPYRTKSSGHFDFFGAINDLIKLKKDEKVTDDKFFSELFKTNTGWLYSTVIVCQFMDSVAGMGDGTRKAMIDTWPYPK